MTQCQSETTVKKGEANQPVHEIKTRKISSGHRRYDAKYVLGNTKIMQEKERERESGRPFTNSSFCPEGSSEPQGFPAVSCHPNSQGDRWSKLFAELIRSVTRTTKMRFPAQFQTYVPRVLSTSGNFGGQS